ncbi:MAG: efflux RND transporter periplasmic adaptor subunit [bacterium]|nr:efflux RND transporter periplasmic adaptor subunit [bacterium]
MKTASTKWLPWLALVIIASVGLYIWLFWGNSDHTGTDSTQSLTTEIYTCPMDPQVQEDKPGKCPICGMNLVLRKADLTQPKSDKSESPEKETNSESTEKYQCPMHPAIVQDHPGDCPICGMKLVKMKGSASDQSKPSSSSSHKVAFYRSPMDPNQTSPVPRKDEMGMDYLPVYEEDSSGDTDVKDRAAVEIDPTRQQLIGLRTAKAERAGIAGGWRTVGRVEIDPTRVSRINVKVTGFVEHVFVDFVGRAVKRGEPLFTLYSPDLLAAQQEYVLALENRKNNTYDGQAAMYDAVISAVRKKLKNWDVPESAIARLEETRETTKALTFTSPVSGVVTSKDVVEGATLEPGAVPYEITDLNVAWVMADAYQLDLAQVHMGTRASMSFDALPDRVIIGTVAFVDPILDVQSRTAKVRLEVQNEDGELKPGMFGEVLFRGESRESLTIPSDALIPTGRGFYVFVALGEGRFEPRSVKLGEKSSDRVEIIEGLSEGESVVTRANFLVDSESSLRAALSAVEGN